MIYGIKVNLCFINYVCSERRKNYLWLQDPYRNLRNGATVFKALGIESHGMHLVSFDYFLYGAWIIVRMLFSKIVCDASSLIIKPCKAF